MLARSCAFIIGAVLALIISLSTSGTFRSAKADTGYWADGWPACNWWGSTWFSGSTGWARTEGPSSCTDFAALRLQWYDGSSWHDTGLTYSASGVTWRQLGGTPSTTIVGTHQIYVIGWGYSNFGYTQE